MWALRRSVVPLRTHGYHVGATRTCCAKLDTLTTDLEHKVETCSTQFVSTGYRAWSKRSYQSLSSHLKFSSASRGLSSQAGAESSEEGSVEDGFSELESPSSEIAEGKTVKEEISEDLNSEPELSDDDEAEVSLRELGLSDTDQNAVEEISSKKATDSGLLKVLMAATRNSLDSELNKWDEEGKPLGRSEISLAMLNLRKRRWYGKALQFSEWLESKDKITYAERDYASRLDLIAKVRGLQQAEKYIKGIPESFRGEVIYRTLLANCVTASNLKKAEEVYNKMRDMEFELTAFSCNQLLLLYKKLDKKKLADVLLFMEKENIKPNLFTYKVLIDAKGQANDIGGMEQLLETMKEQGFEPDISTHSTVARHYVYGGFNDKAEAVLKDMEGSDLKKNRGACRSLLLLYADLGKADEVDRVWKVCDPNPRMDECLAAIEAWGKLGKIEEAEAVFNKMTKIWKNPSAKHFTTLLQVYANNKMLMKGKDLAKRMHECGCRIGPWTWDALVKLYVQAGEVEKADSILNKASQQNQIKPLFNTYMHIMDHYARRGDVHNTEKMFHRLKQAGYVGRIRQYQTLLQAYIKAKAPAYGFRERMKADDVFPNKLVAAQLVQIDAFRKTAISELLD
ncbi:Pentatricopeptide repeat-containing protein [Thalictrum thalictroides]|uniref:Pentatricopeptide repeat-containing protein n=1 Tax=Thalictrum thalictroides TaxID=46969 RepID=A0A7J6WCR3_THATH|nr:Pentatricopeptide repeat-containing protein [Thalictrum thalictroides]